MPVTVINNSLGIPFTQLLSVDSTNNYAMQQVHKNLSQHGAAYFAHHQFQGKGQRGKQWQSNAGENIILSVVLNASSLQVSDQFLLSIAVSLAVYDFFKIYTLTNVSVKWPNDLYWCDRKAGGILIENIIRGKDWQWAIAGIGININQTGFDSFIADAVSLKQITGKTYEPVTLAKELCSLLEKRYRQLLNNETELLLQEYNTVLYKRGEIIKLKKGNNIFDALIKGVNINGQLLAESGGDKNFNVGEAEWIL